MRTTIISGHGCLAWPNLVTFENYCVEAVTFQALDMQSTVYYTEQLRDCHLVSVRLF